MVTILEFNKSMNTMFISWNVSSIFGIVNTFVVMKSAVIEKRVLVDSMTSNATIELDNLYDNVSVTVEVFDECGQRVTSEPKSSLFPEMPTTECIATTTISVQPSCSDEDSATSSISPSPSSTTFSDYGGRYIDT